MNVLVIVPAYNEAENIERVAEEIRACGYDFAVVNDGSADGTGEICRRAGYPLLDLPVNLGLSGAFRTGMRYAWEKGYDAAVQIDADGQHDPKYIEPMIRVMEETGADIVVGSRFVSEKKPRTLRMFGNSIIELAVRITTGKKLTDPTSGMRLYCRTVLEEMAYGVNYGPEPDTLAWLIRSGAKVEETQVTMRERVYGESYLTAWKSMRYMAQMCMNILFIQWVRKRRKAK